jgi:CheY-like chemotaxis protein
MEWLMVAETQSGLRVLVVEDEATAGDIVLRYLSQCGHRVSLANCPDKAIREANRLQPEVIVCDCNLEAEADGIAVAQTLQHRHHSAVIFVTACRERDLEHVSSNVYFFAWLRKPILLQELAECVQQAAHEYPVPQVSTL